MIRTLAALILALASLGGALPAQVVTATKLVSYRKGKELLRKINGRWWTQDNREVYPPSKTGVFWEIDSEPGVVDFFHHTPADLSRAESLHLFMTPPQVEALLGKPNRIFRMGPDGGEWMYYAANGTILEVRIMEGVLGEADYRPLDGKKTSVAAITRELGGQSIYHLLAQRATQRSAAEQATRVAQLPPPPTREEHERRIAELRNRTRAGAIQATGRPAVIAPPTPEPKKHQVSRESLASIKIGATRAEVLATLGEPTGRYSMAGDDGIRETFRYHRADGTAVDIKLVDGKVSVIPE